MIHAFWLIVKLSFVGVLHDAFGITARSDWAVWCILVVAGFLVWFARQPLLTRRVKAEKTEPGNLD